jgi:hypothetical protein
MGLPASPQEALEAYTQLVTTTPLEVRVGAGVMSLLLLFAGARLYRVAVVLPGVLAGVFVAAALPPTMDFEWRLVIGIVVSLVGGLALFFMEKVGVVLVGGLLTGWLTWVIWPLLVHTPAPWWAVGVGGLAGMIAFPAIFRSAVRWITSALGALLGAWALGYPTNALVILALAAVGVMFQYLTTHRGHDEEFTT